LPQAFDVYHVGGRHLAGTRLTIFAGFIVLLEDSSAQGFPIAAWILHICDLTPRLPLVTQALVIGHVSGREVEFWRTLCSDAGIHLLDIGFAQ